MKIIKPILFIVAAVSFHLSVFAADSVELRTVAAERHIKAVPMDKIINDAFLEMANQLPEEKREGFIKDMYKIVRIDYMTNVSKDAMIKVFTADEINAMTDFYSSKEGISIVNKFGAYMGYVTPAIQGEIQRASEQILK